ncbi:signal peptide-containing protein [Rutstroemia sp. NJR-2017a WRK4]|nr:signal peptide-containing protein [Rutstroemia sp. NJR-2017a WRK4]
MQFLSIPVFALLATSVLAMPNSFEAREAEAGQLVARVNCGQILPACNGGHVVGQTDCRCHGQVERCDLWTCPGGAPNVMVCGQNGSGCVWI